jgi:hypothetical protein
MRMVRINPPFTIILRTLSSYSLLEIMTIKKVESVSNEEWDGEGEL